MIENGANINALDANAKTPLHLAAQYNLNSVSVRALIENGANIDTLDSNAKTPLQLAKQYNRNFGFTKSFIQNASKLHASKQLDLRLRD